MEQNASWQEFTLLGYYYAQQFQILERIPDAIAPFKEPGGKLMFHLRAIFL
jgi:hypothetical protein